MPNMKLPVVACALYAVSILSAAAQTGAGDEVPEPFPQTGFWSPKDGSGAAIFLEVQNGIVVGSVVGADAFGDNTWLLFSGELIPREEPGPGGLSPPGWELTATLYLTSDSACVVDCPAGGVPGAPVTEAAGQIDLAFAGRAEATYRIDGGEARPIAPFYFGVPAKRFNPERPIEFLPELTGIWVAVSRREPDGPAAENISTAVLEIGAPEVIRNPSAGIGEIEVEVVYPVDFVNFGISGELFCRFRRRENPSDAIPSCLINPGFAEMSAGGIPFDELTDSRFTAFTGSDVVGLITRTEFFRLRYD